MSDFAVGPGASKRRLTQNRSRKANACYSVIRRILEELYFGYLGPVKFADPLRA